MRSKGARRPLACTGRQEQTGQLAGAAGRQAAAAQRRGTRGWRTCAGRRQRAPHRGQAVHVLRGVLDHPAGQPQGAGRRGQLGTGSAASRGTIRCAALLRAPAPWDAASRRSARQADFSSAELQAVGGAHLYRPLLSSVASTGRLWKRRQPTAGRGGARRWAVGGPPGDTRACQDRALTRRHLQPAS